MSTSDWASILTAAVVAMLPLLLAAVGGLISDRVGVFNFGIEGVMLVGAVVGFMAAFDYESPGIGILAGGVAGGLFTLILYALPVVYLRASPILMSFAIWFVGVGLSGQLGVGYTNQPLQNPIRTWDIPVLGDAPVIGPALFQQAWPFYASVVILVGVWWLLSRSRHGLNIRSLGEDPGAAYASGVPVQRLRVLYVTVGGAFMGVGGAILSIVIVQAWLSEMVAGRGFIAIALVIVASWRPLALVWAGGIFGLMTALASFGQVRGWSVPSEMLSMTPYVLTVLALTVQAAIARARGGGSPAPAALGAGFYRGQR